LRRARLAPERTGQAPALLKMLPTGYRYAGTLACLECHASDNDFHKTTKHFSGLETLRRKSFEFDPYCLKCHTTGYGGPGGFVDAETSPKLGGIGCESCHGPAQAHVQNPRVKTMVSARTACITCHDPENSPAFNFDQYWPKIKHGSVKATKWVHAVAAEGSVNDTK
jgi:hypothetical protein